MNLNTIISHELNKLGKPINIEDYSFLNTNPNLHSPILIGLGGSHAYGTNIETSDLDIRGIALNSKKEILLGHGFEQVVNETTDTTIYSLRKIVNLLANSNPNTVEILGLKQEHYLYLSPIGKELLANKDMFLSNRCVHSFMGYANSQLYRLQQKSLVAMTDEEFNTHICKTLNRMKITLAEKYKVDGIEATMKNGKIVFNIHIEDYPAEDITSILEVFNNTLKEYRSASKRNENAVRHNKIAKHAMHLIRLYMMCEDLLLNGEINTYREKEHDLLMSIRNGEFLGEDSKPNQEFFNMVQEYESRIQFAKKHSVLPDKPDMEKIEKFMIDVNSKIVLGEV